MRRSILISSSAAAALALAPHAAAQGVGPWQVTGDIAGRHFVLDCRFAPQAARFGGTCTEMGGSDARVKPGKVHTLSQGSIDGSRIHWAYPLKIMFMSFDIDFAGTVAGNTMAGDISAAGRKGRFTAIRKPA